MRSQKRQRELERFKTEINLVKYAISMGYEYLSNESSPSSAVLRHLGGDLILVATDTDGCGIYFSLNNDSDCASSSDLANRGTIIDFVQHRRSLNLGEVRLELRPWLSRGVRLLDDNVAKPKPTGRDKINECFLRLKKPHQSPLRASKPKPNPKKRRQLEL